MTLGARVRVVESGVVAISSLLARDLAGTTCADMSPSETIQAELLAHGCSLPIGSCHLTIEGRMSLGTAEQATLSWGTGCEGGGRRRPVYASWLRPRGCAIPSRGAIQLLVSRTSLLSFDVGLEHQHDPG